MLKPGAGNAPRDKAKAMQTDLANVSSENNVLLGQIAFDSVTAARMAAQSGTPLGAAGQISLGLAVSATAGALIGAGMAVRQSIATIDVPKPDPLREAANANLANGAAALAALPAAAVSGDIETGHAATVAQPHQQEQMSRMHGVIAQVTRLVGAVGSLATAPASAVAKAFAAGPLLDPQPTVDGASPSGPALRTWNTTLNVLASAVRRTKLMAASTATTTLMSTGSSMLASATEGAARGIGGGYSFGIHQAIVPWFSLMR